VPKEIKKARAKTRGEEYLVEICGRPVPAVNTPQGVRAVHKRKPVEPEPVEKYLAGKFGDKLEPVRQGMRALAKAFKPEQLATTAFRLYEKFRPVVPEDATGWGAKGVLDLDRIRSLAEKR
jgi:hypothetical protein